MAEGKAKSRYLIVPRQESVAEREAFIASLEERATDAGTFITGVTIDYNGTQDGGLAQYDTASGNLRINAWHPFVATFYDEFASKGAGQPLELFAMAEVLAEAHLNAIGVRLQQIEEFLTRRDQLLRCLANESGRQGAFAVAAALLDARNNPDALEEKTCDAVRSLGFEVTRIGGSGEPDGVALAILPADDKGKPGQYSVSLEAKSREKDQGKVAAGTVRVSAVVRQRDKYKCNHALVVGRAFQKGALATEIDDDRKKTAALGESKTITLITIDDLATLVRLRPVKQIGLRRLRDLFTNCRLPEESAKWVESVQAETVSRPPYKRIVETIEKLQRKFNKMPVKYSALMVELSHLTPPIEYETEESLIELCRGMSQMAPGMYASQETVELDQSAANVLAAIDDATKEYRDGGPSVRRTRPRFPYDDPN